jgi:prevent-host-death family protein
MTTVDIQEAKSQFSRLLARVEKGEEIVIAKAGRPIAKLIPYRSNRGPRVPDTEKGRIWMADDFMKTSQDVIDEFEKDNLG